MKKFLWLFILLPLMVQAVEPGVRIFRLISPGKYEKIYENSSVKSGKLELADRVSVEISE